MAARFENSTVAGGCLVWNDSQSRQRLDDFSLPSVKIPKNMRLLSNWGLPASVLHEYYRKGVIEMFEWQQICLSNINVIMSANNQINVDSFLFCIFRCF